MEGGALLGVGGFGCVFDPPLLCSNRRVADSKSEKVGKLGERREADTEIRMARLLSPVENSKEYYSLADLNNICKFDDIVKDSAAKKDLNECKIECRTIRKYGTSDTIYYSMPFGGVSIDRYLGGIPKGPKEAVIKPRVVITHLLEAVATLTLNKIIHFDIHFGNILVDEKSHLPRLIDFGLSFTADQISKNFLDENWKGFNPSHPTESPEITIINGIRNGMKYKSVFKEVLYKKIPLKRANDVLGMSFSSQGKAFQAFWDHSHSVKKQDWVSFFKFYWPGFDAWSIGNTILKMYILFSLDPAYYENAEWKMTSSNVKEILRGLLQMSPQRRFDAVEALAIFDPENRVVSSPSGKAWLKEKEKIRAAF